MEIKYVMQTFNNSVYGLKPSALFLDMAMAKCQKSLMAIAPTCIQPSAVPTLYPVSLLYMVITIQNKKTTKIRKYFPLFMFLSYQCYLSTKCNTLSTKH